MLRDESLTAVDVGTLHERYAADAEPEVEAELLRRHSGLAYTAANRFAGRGEPIEDLEQVALVGLWLALRRFDPGRGLRFSTFATATVLGELKRHLRDKAWLVKPPRAVQEAYLATRGARDELEHELAREPTVAELASATNLSAAQVVDGLAAVGARSAAASLDAPLSRHEDVTLVDAIADDNRSFAAAENGLAVAALLDTVAEPGRTALALRYLENAPLREIAARLGVSQVTVARVIDRALERLRHISVHETYAA
jgi:RNA polymerase sigma-B factor